MPEITETTEPDLITEVEELLTGWRPSEIVKQPEQVRELLRRLVAEVKIFRECHEKGPHTIDCALLQQRRGTWTKNK